MSKWHYLFLKPKHADVQARMYLLVQKKDDDSSKDSTRLNEEHMKDLIIDSYGKSVLQLTTMTIKTIFLPSLSNVLLKSINAYVSGTDSTLRQ